MTALQFLGVLVGIAASLAVIMAGAWLLWRRTGNSGWIDTTWTFGLGVVGCGGALFPSLASGALTARQGLIVFLMAIWSLRLGAHIAHRTAGIHDDPRYAKLQRDWAGDAVRQMFWLCEKQAAVSIPLALSVVIAAWNPLPGLRLQDFAGVLALVIGIFGEAVADRQLRRFRSDPANRGRICDVGLWGWSRHPNYFFEWFGWLAYPLLAIDVTGAYPWGWLSLLGPVFMYWLLAYVSGIPPLEAHMLETRGAAFRDYQARTSAFFPAPPGIG